MCNVAKLRGKMAELGIDQETLANMIGVDRSTMNRKLKTGESFTVGQANAIVHELSLSKDEAMFIFFPNIVA